jgi:hypothetical protein
MLEASVVRRVLSAMKKLFLPGIAALFLVTGTAHADGNTRFPLPNVPMPEEMLGDWCLDSSGGGVSHYARPEDEKEGCHEQALTIRPDGWDEVWDNCPFTKVTKEADGVYLIYSRCEILSESTGHGNGSYFIVNQEYQIAENGQLIVRLVPEL